MASGLMTTSISPVLSLGIEVILFEGLFLNTQLGRFSPGAEGQTACHRDQLVSSLDAFGAETVLKNVTYGGHKRRSAGHEHGIDLLGRHIALLQQSVDASGDRGNFLCDPAFEFRARYRL